MAPELKISRWHIIVLFVGFCAVAAASALPIAANGTEAEAPKRFDLAVVGRKVELPDSVLRVDEGDQVELHWTSDEAALLHLHGYNIEMPLTPGAPAVFTFEAHTAGRFPVTSHGFAGESEDGDHEALFYFEVYPR